MSSQSDWVGAPPTVVVPFRDIRNTRQSVAEEKAQLAHELGSLARKAPPGCMDWSVQRTDNFRGAVARAVKVAGAKRSTVPELTSALNNLRSFWSQQ
jgi:hypothetical protein